MNITRKQAEQIVGTIFGAYRGRKFRLVVRDSVILCDLNWSGGTCNKWSFARLEDRRVIGSDFEARAPWNQPMEGLKVPLVRGFAVICHAHFCGNDSGWTIYVCADSVPMLPAGLAVPALAA